MDFGYWMTLAFIAWMAFFSYSLKFKAVARLLPKNTKDKVEMFWLKVGGLLGVVYILIGLETNEIVWTLLGIIFLLIWGWETIMK